MSNLSNSILFCISRDISDILLLQQKAMKSSDNNNNNNNDNENWKEMKVLNQARLAIDVCKILTLDVQIKKAAFVFFGIEVNRRNLVHAIVSSVIIRTCAYLALHT